MVVFPSVDAAARAEFEDALEIVARAHGMTSRDLRRSFRIRLANTEAGAREYRRLRGEWPVLDDTGCEYGHVEEHQRTQFIFIKPELWDSGVDAIPTFIHELLHVMRPSDDEASIRKMEQELCESEGIPFDDVLE